MPHARVNGVRLYYEERGSGTPILGVHGAGSSALFWEDAAERLAALGRVIVYDRRGCTRSERPEPYDATSVREQADDALALLRELDAVPAVVVGRSYGGVVALELALEQPDAVVALALLEADPEGLSPEYDEWLGALREKIEELAEAGRVDAVGEAVVRHFVSEWEELPAAFRDVFTANGPALVAEIRGGARMESSRLSELPVSTLVVTAEDSPPPVRRASEALADAIPGVRRVRAAGGHVIDPAGPDVRAFVEEVLA